jgi:L-fuconolactonase
MGSEALIVDAQLHEPPVRLDWSSHDVDTRRKLLSELAFGWMDAIGVDAAVIHPHQDDGWGAQLAARFPSRCAVVFHADTTVPDPDAYVADLKSRQPEGVLGLRAMLGKGPAAGSEPAIRAELLGYEPFFAACEKYGLPMFFWVARFPSAAAEMAERYPDLLLIMDHLTLRQGPTEPRESPPFRSLPQLLALAQYPNVAVKLSGAPALAEREYPFEDLWPHLDQIIEAFGPERLMWGSDASRIAGRIGTRTMAAVPFPGHHTYAEALHYIRDTDHLGASEKASILGGTAQRLLGWPRP